MTLPNWAKLALGLALVIVTWIMNAQASGQLVLPAVLMTALALVKTVVGMLTDGVPTATAKIRARRALSRVGTSVVMLVPVALLACRCTPSQQGQVVSTVPVAVNLVDCIYQHVDGCIVAHTPWTTCTAQVAEACGTDVASVVSIWASKRAAEARESDAGASYP